MSIIEDLSALTAYGVEESAWANGFVRGVIDADFLSPLPARSGFEENVDWIALLDLLDRYLPTLEAEIESHLVEHRARQASEIGARALRLAREILDLDQFRDLALPGGLAKRGRPEVTRRRTGEREGRKPRQGNDAPVTPGTNSSPHGRRIRYEEVPFEDGRQSHSRFVAGVVQANTLHPDFQKAARSVESRLTYAAVMIGKESIAFNYWISISRCRNAGRSAAEDGRRRSAPGRSAWSWTQTVSDPAADRLPRCSASRRGFRLSPCPRRAYLRSVGRMNRS